MLKERRSRFVAAVGATIVVAAVVFLLSTEFGRAIVAAARRPGPQISLSGPQPRADAPTRLGSDAFVHGSGWERVVGQTDGRFDGSSLRSFRPGASATLDFYGEAIRVFGVVGPGGGNGEVAIDGGPVRKLDFFSPRKSTHSLIYASPPLARRKHSLSITVTPKPAATAPGYVNIDGIEYDP